MYLVCVSNKPLFVTNAVPRPGILTENWSDDVDENEMVMAIIDFLYDWSI